MSEYRGENYGVCPTCGQSTTYELSMDRGTARMIVKIARFVERKGINAFSNTKEIMGPYVGPDSDQYDHNSAGNISRPRMHGLIARIPGKATNYCITDKGFAFLTR